MSADVPTLSDAQAAAQLLAAYLNTRPVVISPVADATATNLMAYPAQANVVATTAVFDPAAKFVDVYFAPDKAPTATIFLTVVTRDGSLTERWFYSKTQEVKVWQPDETTPKSVRIPLTGAAKDGAYLQLILTPTGGKVSIINVTAKAGAPATVAAANVDAVLPPFPTTAPTYTLDIPHLKWTGCGATGWTTDCVYNAQGANGETGFYADVDHPMASDGPPIQVVNGKLILHTSPLTTPFTYGGKTYNQQGAILVGYREPGVAFRFGWSETCAQMPSWKGTWRALWFEPLNHVWSGEIDLDEGFPNNASFDIASMTHHAIHGLNGSFGFNSGFLRPGPNDLTSATHCYGVVVDAQHITYYLDRKPNYQMVNPFPQTSFIPIFSVAVVNPGPYTPGSGDMIISSYQSRTER